METLTRGRSLGKLALGLRTVRDDAGPISFRHAFVRALVGCRRDLAVPRRPGAGLRAGQPARQAARRRGRRHLRRPRAVRLPARPAGDDAAARWPAGRARADMAPLPDGLALAVRQFLDRAGVAQPGVPRHARPQLPDAGARRTSPRPRRAGQHPEAVLAAVVAERRRRDEARLARDAALRARLRSR